MRVRRTGWGTALVLGVVLGWAVGARAQGAAVDGAQVETGRRLAVAADCLACHTAPKGGKPFAGGHAIASPLGEIHATNITPSYSAGIGGYTLEDCVMPSGSCMNPTFTGAALSVRIADTLLKEI